MYVIKLCVSLPLRASASPLGLSLPHCSLLVFHSFSRLLVLFFCTSILQLFNSLFNFPWFALLTVAVMLFWGYFWLTLALMAFVCACFLCVCVCVAAHEHARACAHVCVCV